MNAIETARRLATALDAEDYAAAAALLAPDCVYVTGSSGTLQGPEAIVASYREAGEWVQAHVAAHGYEHRLRPGPVPGCAIVTFIDHLDVGGDRHTYRCEQVLQVGPQGLIERIEHVEVPGEAERLNDWFGRVGLQR